MPAALEHHEVTTSYRPPRVAVLTYAGSSWQAWAREALAAISRVWGGEGFVVIPYGARGEVAPALLLQLRRYDPDYIAVFAPGEATWAALSPETLNDRLVNDDIDERVSVAPTVAAIAAATVGAECVLLHGYTDGLPIPDYLRLRAAGETLPPQLLPLPPIALPPAAQVASTQWNSDAALFAAYVTGRPAMGADEEAQPPAAAADLIRWTASRENSRAPEALAWFARMTLSSRSSDLRPWFSALDDDLIWWTDDAYPARVTASYGDAAEDFALAVLFDRLHGQALWITTTMLDEDAERLSLAEGLRDRMTFDPFERPGLLATASMTAAELDHAIAQLRSIVHVAGLEDAEERLHASTLPLSAPIRRLLITTHANHRTTYPFLITTDGTATLAHDPLLPLPPNVLSFLTDSHRPAWLVDATIDRPQAPYGRGTTAKHLHAAGQATWADMRDGRDGITFDAAFTGYLPPETPLQHTLARPRVQFLGLMSWVQQAAARRHMRATPSRPGQLSDLVSDRLGGRQALRQLVGSSFGQGLRLFLAKEASGAGHVRLRRDAGYESFLTFDAFLAQGTITDPDILRDEFDAMLQVGILSRGLMLDCGECGTLQFTPIDRAGSSFVCSRCGATNALVADRWKRNRSEPEFYYDLHPALRTVLRDSGDLPLLLGSRLARLSVDYNDLSEIEFTAAGAKKPSFEIDLIAHRDGDLIVGECKESSLGSGAQRKQLIAKRLDAAELLGADRIVFGTALPEWPQRDVDAVHAMASAHRIDLPVDFIADLRQ